MHALALATHFLAQTPAPHAAASLDASNPTVFMGLLIAALTGIAILVDRVDSFVQRRRRTPAIETEFARKEEVAAVERRISAIEDDLKGIQSTLQTGFIDIYRALGIAEGKLSRAPRARVEVPRE